MRLGVLDVGSNTVHLLVVDAYQGARPVPAFSHKAEFRLGDHLDAANRLTPDCAAQLRDFVDEALRIAEDKGVQELLAFATSAVRDAGNGDELLAWIQAETRGNIRVLPGPDESRLTVPAAPRWFGWAAGRLLGLGIRRRPLGSPSRGRDGAGGAGAAPSSDGPYVRRILRHADVTALAERLSRTTAAHRGQLPGVSRGRAPQLAAGAIVADATMDLFGLPELEVCPWALREGVILRRLDTPAESPAPARRS